MDNIATLQAEWMRWNGELKKLYSLKNFSGRYRFPLCIRYRERQRAEVEVKLGITPSKTKELHDG